MISYNLILTDNINQNGQWYPISYHSTTEVYPCGAETGIFWKKAADVLAPSAAIIMLDEWDLGPDSILRCRLTGIGNPIVEIRRSYDRLISTMGFPIPVRRHLYIELGPWSSTRTDFNYLHHLSAEKLEDINIFSWSLKTIQHVNLLAPRKAIWHHWIWSTLVEVMACCLMASCHYLNQYWLTVDEILWHWLWKFANKMLKSSIN